MKVDPFISLRFRLMATFSGRRFGLFCSKRKSESILITNKTVVAFLLAKSRGTSRLFLEQCADRISKAIFNRSVL
ncbi:unnamed protein product [Tenebrio molitor]|nr:unnamed protein product [Tenebrio molitor]